LRGIANARYVSHFGFALACEELRHFAAKMSQTVEATVKNSAEHEFLSVHGPACVLVEVFMAGTKSKAVNPHRERSAIISKKLRLF
jgi:hypothetical protein